MTFRILVALDGSGASESALGEAERICGGAAGVHFLDVVPLLPQTVDATSAGVLAGHDRALSYLRVLRARLPDIRGLDLIRTGDPAEAILQASLEFDVGLIAMGLSPGAPGSMTGDVLRQTRVPVLLKRPDRALAHPKLRRILVPLDGSVESLSILPAVLTLALRIGAEVVFLHVAEGALSASGPLSEVLVPADPKEKFLALEDRLHKSDLDFWQTVAPGDAVEQILEHAKTLDADLIAMSTQVGEDPVLATVGIPALAIVERTDRAVLLQRPTLRPVASTAWKYQ
jgi:nucleotide-binding universal stress UspA family protein